MRRLGTYKKFKLYEVTEKDIAEGGGAAESRYIRNDVLVFLPDDENPRLGYEEWEAGSQKEAEDFIDSYDKDSIEKQSIKSKMEAAKEQSQQHRDRERQRETERRRTEAYEHNR